MLSSITFLINVLPSWLFCSVLKDFSCPKQAVTVLLCWVTWSKSYLLTVPVECAFNTFLLPYFSYLYTVCCQSTAVSGSKGSASVSLLLFADKQL